MEVEILEVIKETYVRVNSNCGTFIGKWRGDNIPQIGKEDVEIDYNEIVSYEIVNEENYHIKNINGKNVICGFVIDEWSMDENNPNVFAQYLDICGEGECVIVVMVNTEGNSVKNKFLKLEVNEIELWSTNY
jgi:hypothetical protein